MLPCNVAFKGWTVWLESDQFFAGKFFNYNDDSQTATDPNDDDQSCVFRIGRGHRLIIIVISVCHLS